MNDAAVILLSGGMDSAVLLAWAVKRHGTVHTLNFNYGSKHSRKEIAMARLLAQNCGAVFTEVDLPFFGTLFTSSLLLSGEEIPDGPYRADSISSTVVPFRNGIMLSVAAGYAETHAIPLVLIASHAGDHPVYPDCTNDFIEAMSRAATLGTFAGVRIEAPFAGLDKRAIARIGRDMGVDFTRTWSCYKGLDLHCGTCATCLERKYALEHDSGLDPTRYLA
ncbi:MAG TPA: 7-cyano-7-deazaguanine synthase QueC [Deltaproteobacteria bacterium]|nr:7-cyano-7-deazaguanine synthase QueC [Deltaproteobacteria bacterium]